MRQHYREIRATFDADGANWPALMKVLEDQGVTDWTGKPPVLRTAQQTWYRVHKEMRGRPGKPAKLPSPPVHPAVRPVVGQELQPSSTASTPSGRPTFAPVALVDQRVPAPRHRVAPSGTERTASTLKPEADVDAVMKLVRGGSEPSNKG